MSDADPVVQNLDRPGDTREAAFPINGPCYTRVQPESKKGVEGYNDAKKLLSPAEARSRLDRGKNVGYALGPVTDDDTALVVIDVEEVHALPNEAARLVDQHAVVTWSSPHGGRNRLLRVTLAAHDVLDTADTKVHVTDGGDHDIDLLTNGHAIAPGSVINHEECKSSKERCPGQGTGSYDYVATNPDAEPLDRDDASELLDTLDHQPDATDTRSVQSSGDYELPDVDDELADVGEAMLQTLQESATPAFTSLIGLLRGGDGGFEDLLWIDTDTGRCMDRSLHDLVTLTRLYETVVYIGHEDGKQAEAIARSTFERYVSEHNATDDHQVRKWLRRGEAYKKDRMKRAVEECDRGKFQRFKHRNPIDDERERWTNETSDVTDGIARFALDHLTGNVPEMEVTDFDDSDDVAHLRDMIGVLYSIDVGVGKLRELYTSSPPPPVQDVNPSTEGTASGSHRGSNTCRPTKREWLRVIQILDPSRQVGYYKKRVTHDLQKRGDVKQAYCPERPNGERYVYYGATLSDPEDARYVRTNGEKREPEEPPSEDGAPQVMTDGGEGSTQEETSTESETRGCQEDLRHRFSEIVVSSSGKSNKRVHIPGGDGTPLCETVLRSKSWRTKPTDSLPPEWVEWCDRCRARLQERERAEASSLPTWIVTGEVTTGDALEPDWTGSGEPILN
jgi:hypothetical protein